jgi:hypothetical protein
MRNKGEDALYSPDDVIGRARSRAGGESRARADVIGWGTGRSPIGPRAVIYLRAGLESERGIKLFEAHSTPPVDAPPARTGASYGRGSTVWGRCRSTPPVVPARVLRARRLKVAYDDGWLCRRRNRTPAPFPLPHLFMEKPGG